MTNDIAERSEEFRYLILALQRQGNRQLNSLFSKIGLTASQAEAIEIIGTYGPMSTRETGDLLICESGSPSRLLATLASKNLTMISQSSLDKRVTLHALTPQGRDAFREIKTLKSDFDKQLSLGLSRSMELYPGDFITQLASLLQVPDLLEAMKNRYPNIFDKV